jgi:hypothetical protein
MQVKERWGELASNAKRVSHLTLRAALAELAQPRDETPPPKILEEFDEDLQPAIMKQ